MRMKPSMGSVVAPTDDSHWGQVLILPTAYGVVEVSDEEGRARDIGLKLLSALSERLSNPVLSLSGVEAIAREAAHQAVVSLLLLVPVGMTTYLVLAGEGAVYIKRGDRLAKLLSAAGSLSGQLQPADTLLLVTKRFETAVGDDQLSAAFDHLDPSAIAEKLTVRLAEEAEAVGAAGLVFCVDHVVATEEEEIPDPVEPEAPIAAPLRFRERLNPRRMRRVIGQRFPRVRYIWHRGRERFAGKNGVLLAVVIVSGILFFGSVVLGIRKQLSVGRDTHVAVF